MQRAPAPSTPAVSPSAVAIPAPPKDRLFDLAQQFLRLPQDNFDVSVSIGSAYAEGLHHLCDNNSRSSEYILTYSTITQLPYKGTGQSLGPS